MYKITERQIIGIIFQYLAEVIDGSWVGNLSLPIDSDQASEEYAWLGASPAMREWIGGRQAKGLLENQFKITNKKYEATVEILCDWLRRDKTGQVMQRVAQLAGRANTHWARLLSSLIIDGESSVCYDGQFFFDTDHAEGSSGTQSNDIAITVSGLPVVAPAGTAAAPSPQTMQYCIIKAIAQMLGIKDDQGEPMNEDARKFIVMTPISLWIPAKNALAMPHKATGESTQLALDDFEITVAGNARLNWTTKFAAFRADGPNKPFIRQEEVPLKVTAKAEGSELEFDDDKHHYGVWASRSAGYGFWQSSCLVTMS